MQRLQRIVRSARRLLALGTVLAFYAAAFFALPSHRRSVAARARWLSQTSRAVLKAIGVRFSVVGQPSHGAVIVSNHLSYLDILVLAAQTPVVFVAKREVSDWLVFGWFARMAGTQFIDRTRRADVTRVGAQFSPALENGVAIALFLEGTSSGGREVLPFKSSLLAPIVDARLPVAPVAISYVVPPGHAATTEVCWWGDMTLTPHLLNLLSLPRVHAFVGWGKPVHGATDRKELAAIVHGRVVAMHRAMSGCADAPTDATTLQPMENATPPGFSL